MDKALFNFVWDGGSADYFDCDVSGTDRHYDLQHSFSTHRPNPASTGSGASRFLLGDGRCVLVVSWETHTWSWTPLNRIFYFLYTGRIRLRTLECVKLLPSYRPHYGKCVTVSTIKRWRARMCSNLLRIADGRCTDCSELEQETCRHILRNRSPLHSSAHWARPDEIGARRRNRTTALYLQMMGFCHRFDV